MTRCPAERAAVTNSSGDSSVFCGGTHRLERFAAWCCLVLPLHTLLRRNWKLLCSVLHTYSVTLRQHLCILGRYGAIEIVLLLLLLLLILLLLLLLLLLLRCMICTGKLAGKLPA